MKNPNELRNMVLYQVFVRQYGMNHNFIDVKNDLPRIKEMGVDILYLMPIFREYLAFQKHGISRLPDESLHYSQI